MNSRKALLVGINDYFNHPLKGCVNDASRIRDLLNTNDDGSDNFDTILLCDIEATKENILNQLHLIFDDESIEIGLFYFAGHGEQFIGGAKLVTSDSSIWFDDITEIVKNAKCTHKVVILDCCFSGRINYKYLSNKIVELSNNTTIITACSDNETAKENKECRGVFSSLVEEALIGGAANVLGDVSPGMLYAYIDSILSSDEQRPLFKANVSTFVSLRKCFPKVDKDLLRECFKLFITSDYQYPLDPSYEWTNNPNYINKCILPYTNENNVKLLQMLQKLNKNGLVEPCDEEHMYFAAMKTRKCKLTSLGRYYWNLNNKGLL